MRLSNCPDAAFFDRAVQNTLSPEETDQFAAHLETCPSCAGRLEKAPVSVHLVQALRSSSTPAPDSPHMQALMAKVERLAAAHKSKGSVRLTVACSGCKKTLSVNEDQVGEKIKCTACGQLTVVPAPVKVAEGAGACAGNQDLPTIPPNAPPAPKPGDAQTADGSAGHTPLHGLDETAVTPQDDYTSFLAPPQAEGELGRLGHYRVLQVLGAGGMGVVFRAEDTHLGRPVALKAMLPNLAASAASRDRFKREARAAAAVKHDHIVAIYQVGEDRNVPYLAMEFLAGESLDSRLERDRTLPISEVLRIGREVAEGLEAAHEADLVHRDIKPANIWLETCPGRKSREPRVKILDFGLARAVSQAGQLTQTGAVIGTPAFMAPEQACGLPLDKRCDLFSLGCVLYRMTTGRNPFRGTDMVSTLMSVANDEPQPPAMSNFDVPAELSDLILKLLAKNPEHRPGSAREVADRMADLGQVSNPRTEKGTLERRPARPRRGRPLLAAVAVAFALFGTLITAAAVFFWQTPQGTVRIEINDPNIQVVFDQKTLTFKGADPQDIRVTPGKEHGLHVERGELRFDTRSIVLEKNQQVTLKVEWLPEGKLVVKQGDQVLGSADSPKVADVGKVAAPPTPAPPPPAAESPKVVAAEAPPVYLDDLKEVKQQCHLGVRKHGDGMGGQPVTVKGKTFAHALVTNTSGPSVAFVTYNLAGGYHTFRATAAVYDSSTNPPLTFRVLGDGGPLWESTSLQRAGDSQAVELDVRGVNTLRLEVAANGGGVGHVVWLEPRLYVAAPKPNPAEAAWVEKVKALPAQQQLEEVKAKLVELDPGFKGNLELIKHEAGSISQLFIRNAPVKDLSPLRALTELRSLTVLCGGDCDLSPLADLKLSYLSLAGSQAVRNLSPLKDVPLRRLLLTGCQAVTDLTPLQNMQLTHLFAGGTSVSDLAPLQGMKRSLTAVDVSSTRVKDLSPLAGMTLSFLHVEKTGVESLSPLKGMPLRELGCDVEVAKRNAEILHSIQTLEKINGVGPKEFWESAGAK
jgi:serine/threonine protein kinase